MSESKQKAPEGGRAVQLTITFNLDTGDLKVNGPWDNPVLCYGMLGMAQQAVDEAVAQGRRAAIAAAQAQQNGKGSGIIVPDFRGPRDINRRRT